MSENLQKYTGIIALLSIIISLIIAHALDYIIPTMRFRTIVIAIILLVFSFIFLIITFFSSPAAPTKQVMKPSGIYRIIRNPVYTIILFILYPALCFLFKTYSGLFLIVPLFFIFIYLSHVEDEHLIELLGNYYKQYQHKTGLFFPKIK